MTSFIRTNKGFSLIELMVVVAIIGILSAIAVPNFQKFQRKARQSEVKSTLSAQFVAIKAFDGEWQSIAASLPEMGYRPEGVMKYSVGLGTGSTLPCPADYPGGVGGDRCTVDFVNSQEDTFLICGNSPPIANPATDDERCQIADDGGTLWTAASPTGAVAAAAGAGGNIFTLAGEGLIGGTQTDQWTMDAQKQMDNPQDGTL